MWAPSENTISQTDMIKSIAILLLACWWGTSTLTEPLDKVYKDSTLSSDLIDILAQDTPDSSAYKGITEYLLVMAFSEEQLVGKTYREILDMSRLWSMKQNIRKEQEKTLAEQESLEQEQRYKRLAKIVQVNLMGKEVRYADSTVTTTYSITLTNESDQTIKALEASLEINYPFYGQFSRLNLTFAPPLLGVSSRQEKIIFQESAGIEQKERSDVLGKAIWRPEKIVFQDGSTVD